jgi:signal transduction histidine kinase/CheY-like chemotaxis protein
MKTHLSIRSTLLIIIGLLNLMIASQVGISVYRAWMNHIYSGRLRENTTIVNLLLKAESALSIERGMAMAIVYALPDARQSLRDEITSSRTEADSALDKALLAIAENSDPDVQKAYSDVLERRKAMQLERRELDDSVRDDRHPESGLPVRIFESETSLTSSIAKLIDVYSRPYLLYNPAAARQIRFSVVIWNIMEYSGREYAIIGQAIAENRFLTLDETQELLTWQGRIQYSWDIANTAIITSNWAEQVRPAMEEAQTQYFMAFEQVKSVFSETPVRNGHPNYPISSTMWLGLASQAVDSLHSMTEAVLKINQLYVDKANSDAERSILINAVWFLAVILLSYYSWRVIVMRVIRPVNSMVDTLYKVTHSEDRERQPLSGDQDEIGKLAAVLQVFQENSRQLAKERDKAQAASIAKTEFLANMSHEIRTPMNVVLGLSSILGRSRPLTEQQQEFIKTLQLSAESLLSLINDLLDFSKTETQAFEIEKIPFNLHDLVEDVIALMSVKAQEKGLNFVTDIERIRNIEFIGDPTRVRQVLINLCGNAVKFTEKGTITLTVERQPQTAPGVDTIRLSVADTGIGIAEDKLDVIFDKFTQADSSINRKYGGTGLGLAIAKSFVEMMDGTLTVESIYGQGTIFTVELPLKVHGVAVPQPPAPAFRERPLETPHNENHASVLLVEDYQPNVLVAATYVEQFGFACDVAENGVQALEKFRQKPYHAVLMDVQMHGMDGYQTTRAIRDYETRKGLRRVRIIGMTAHAMPGDREKCIESGMDDYMSKPFDPEDLREKLVF